MDPSGRSGSPPPLEKQEPLKPEPSPLLPPPPPPPPSDRPRPGSGIRVFVREIRFVGNKAVSTEELHQIAAPYENRELTTEDLEALRLALTVFYINRGYLTSGAIIPDQAVTDGVIVVQIVEGTLSKIEIEGNWWFRSAYLRDRIALGAGPPVNIGPLQERLQLLQQDPRLQQLNAELRPGAVRGDSELHVRLTEATPWKAQASFDNFQTPLVGAERGLATVAHQNLTGNGDIFSFTYGRSLGVDPIVDTFYSLPVTKYDTTVTASYRRNAFVVIETPFTALNISSDAEIIGISIRQPLYRTLNQEVAFTLTGEHLYNKTFLAGEAFDFIAGMQNGVATDTAIRAIQEWTYRTQVSVFAARSRFSVGIDALGATITSGPVADGRFFAWQGQLQAVHRLDRYGGIQLLGRFDIQLADDRLFPLEQLPVGGRFSVRGYRENTLVRDNGMIGSLEARLPVLRSAKGEEVLQLAPFLDYGRAWDNLGPTPEPQFLASLGLGVRWNVLPQERAHFELYWGVPLNHFHAPGAGGNLQDFGLHLQLVAQAF
jgi:hemolysin activation/secretion protein